MEFNSYNLSKFVLGEIRTDGWKSDWRREQERRRAEEPVYLVTTQQIRQKRVRRPEIRSSRHGSRKCSICDTVIRKDNITGRCFAHKVAKMLLNKREAIRDIMRRKRAQRKCDGVCIDCGKNPAKENRTLCQDCLTYRVVSQRARELKRAA